MPLFAICATSDGHSDRVRQRSRPNMSPRGSTRTACAGSIWAAAKASELTTKAKVNFEEVVRAAIREIGYVNDDDVFHADKVFITNLLTKQSPDIAQGVDRDGAGDQGIMFGYACRETPELMPAPIQYSHAILRRLAEVRKSGAEPTLRPDAKSQVTIRYEGEVPIAIEKVVLSTQHLPSVSTEQLRDEVRRLSGRVAL